MAFEEFVAAGFYDPDSPDADERRELIEHLLGRGFAAADIIYISQRTIPAAIAVSLANPRRVETVSLRSVAERCNADLESLVRFRRALGFSSGDPDIPSVDETVADDFTLFLFGCAQYGEDATLAFIRVLGSSVARLMEAAQAMLGNVAVETSATELQMSQRNEAGVGLWRALQTLVGHAMAERLRLNTGFTDAVLHGDLQIAICFVDLVGSTQWTAVRAPGEHAAALSIFERNAMEIATKHRGRVVKLIGDEAMIVAFDSADACQIAVELCAEIEQESSLPPARGAVGFGSVTARDGDYFGPLVNLVARATKAADPGGVVVTSDVAIRLDPTLWSTTIRQPTEFRGIDEQVTLHAISPRG